MSATVDILDVPAPFDMSADAPEEVWVWAFKGLACTCDSGGEEFVLVSHSEEEIRAIMANARRHPASSSQAASLGSPLKVTIEAIEKSIRDSELYAIVGWMLRDRHGEVMRRYVR